MEKLDIVSDLLTNIDRFKVVSVPFLGERNAFYDYDYLSFDLSKLDFRKFKDLSLPWYKRYEDLLPLGSVVHSLGECDTPLIPSSVYKNCYIKEEVRNPSGCFKDRESAVVFSFFSDYDFDEFEIVSSGNAALSASLYGRSYGKKVDCVVPERTSKSKKDLIKLYGGECIEGGADYEECYHSVLEQNSGKVNITPGVLSIRDQGDKMIAYEIFSRIGVPDYVLMPSANGSALFGIFNGFRELKELGLSETVPKMVAVQIDGAAPLLAALDEEKDYVVLEDLTDSKAEGIVAMESYCAPKATYAMRSSNGFVVTVSDDSFDDAMKYAIGKEGVLPEWTSVAGFAALQKVYKEKIIDEESKVVLINSGSGMKDVKSISQSLF